MKLNDLKSKQTAELKELLMQTTKKIAESQFYHARGRSKNVKDVREWRKERARILTLLKEKSI